MKNYSFVFKTIGFALLVILLYNIDWQLVLINFKKLSASTVLISLIILWIGYFLKSLRWKLISHSYKIYISTFFSFKVFCIGMFMGNITPGKLGDFGRLLYLKPYLTNKKVGWISLIVDRLFDLFFLFVFVFIAIVFYYYHFNVFHFSISAQSIVLISLFLIVFFLLVYTLRNRLKNFILPWLSIVRENKLKGLVLCYASLSTVISMLFIYGVINYIAYSMHIEIDHIGLFLGSFVIGVLSLLPISILGIGVRETSLVMVFYLYNLPEEKAVALSIVVFFIQILSLFPGLIWFYQAPIKLTELKKVTIEDW